MEKMYFFDSIEGDERIYQAADFARFHANIVGNGVSNTPNLANLRVTAKNNMETNVGSGYMFANGYMYENTSNLTLAHDTADINLDRIDRVIICFSNDPEERRIKAIIKKGVPSSNPVPPNLTRTEYKHQMSLAQVRIIAGKSFIEQSQITDERANDDVCGYTPLDNIYRGLIVNEKGMVSMINQSFIHTNNQSSFSVYRTGGSVINSIPLKLGHVRRDNQEEVIDDQKFKAKADGIYSFSLQITMSNALNANEVITVYTSKNGTNNYPLGSVKGEQSLYANGFEELKKGDIVEFRYTFISDAESKSANYTILKVSKIS